MNKHCDRDAGFLDVKMQLDALVEHGGEQLCRCIRTSSMRRQLTDGSNHMNGLELRVNSADSGVQCTTARHEIDARVSLMIGGRCENVSRFQPHNGVHQEVGDDPDR